MASARATAHSAGEKRLPARACDAHSHIYGPGAIFPYIRDRTYEPADAPVDTYRGHAEALGFERAVFVQPAVHGSDHAAMLDALEHGGGRFAGVGLVACDVTDDELAMLHRGGLRGARFNFMPHLGPPPPRRDMQSLAQRLAAIGWHVCFHLDMAALRAQADWMASLDCPVVIDHMARISLATPGFDDDLAFVTSLLKGSGIWIKLSGADRAVQSAAELAQMAPVLAQLQEAAPDRCLWGLDWPHPNVRWQPDDRGLLDLVLAVLPDACAIEQIFVENPDRLYFRS